jgi:hypothetical protein
MLIHKKLPEKKSQDVWARNAFIRARNEFSPPQIEWLPDSSRGQLSGCSFIKNCPKKGTMMHGHETPS